MTFIYRDAAHNADGGLMKLLDQLQAGDCIEVESFACAAADQKSFVILLDTLQKRGIRFRSTREQFDTAAPESAAALEVLSALAHMHDQAPKEEEASASAKGRKPISVDSALFDRILELWKNGEITARQAMSELNLKPNTFYRRVKEKMPEFSGTDTILSAAKQLGKDIAQGVQHEAADFSTAASKFAAEHDLDGISQSVKQQVGKSLGSAGSILGRYMDSLTKDIQEAVDRFQQRVQEEAAAVQAAEDAAYEEVKADAQAAPAEEAPVIILPAEDTPAETAPAEEAAPAEAPAEAAEESPAEEAPAEESPVQELSEDIEED